MQPRPEIFDRGCIQFLVRQEWFLNANRKSECSLALSDGRIKTERRCPCDNSLYGLPYALAGMRSLGVTSHTL
jgi:hypothetical protein